MGPILTNPIITLPLGKLSTWRPDASDDYYNSIIPNGIDPFTVGEIWSYPSVQYGDGDDENQDYKPLNIQDLACPTWGLGRSTSADGTVVTTIGPPWLPLIVPPMEIFSLDPVWAAKCTGILQGFYGMSTFALIDPPIALTPKALLLPTSVTRSTSADPITVAEQTTSSAEIAKPASLPYEPAAPARTGDPEKNTPAQSPDIASADPAGSANLPWNSIAPSKNEGDPPSDSRGSSVDGDPPSSSASDLTPGGSQQSPTDPKVLIVPQPQPVEDPQTQAQGLGAFIYNAFGKTGPEPDGSSSLLPPQSIFAAGAQTFTANPTGFKVNGATVAPGGTAQMIDKTIISLDKSGVLAIGGSTVSLANPLATPVLAVAGQTFTPYPSAFAIAGIIISAGGRAVIVDGTVISLGQSGALAIDSTTIDLSTSLYNFFGQAYTVAGQVFTPNPSAFLVADTTISPGGPAVTVDGTIISLEPSDTLIVGSSTISLLPQTAVSSDINIDGFNVIVHSSFAVVDGVTVSAAAAGVTISRKVVSLEAGGATLDIGTGRFILPTSVPGTNGLVNVQAFVGGQSKGLEVSVYLVWGVCGALMLFIWH